MFKCLIFVQGLTVPENGEIRARILSKLEQNPKISLQIVTEEAEGSENFRLRSKDWRKWYVKNKCNQTKTA